MTTLATIGPDPAALSTADLRAELARGLRLAADVLLRLAVVWSELERRGEDLSDLRRGGIYRSIAGIAAGQLAPEAVVEFAGRPAILRAIEGLPLARQRAIAAGEPVEVVVPDSPREVVPMAVTAIPRHLLGRVFVAGQQLSPAEQRVRAGRKYARRPVTEGDGDGRKYRVRYDRDAVTVRVGKVEFPLADLLAAIAASGPGRGMPPVEDVDLDRAEHEMVRLWPEEAERLRAAAKATGLPKWELIRKALQAYGLV